MINGRAELSSYSKSRLAEMGEGLRHLEMPMVKMMSFLHEGAKSENMIPILYGNLKEEVNIHPIGHNEVVIEYYMPYADARYEQNVTGVAHWLEKFEQKHENEVKKILADAVAKEMGF